MTSGIENVRLAILADMADGDTPTPEQIDDHPLPPADVRVVEKIRRLSPV